jgi:hypothetical protein
MNEWHLLVYHHAQCNAVSASFWKYLLVTECNNPPICDVI